MSSSKFFASPDAVLVADASVLINLNASGRAEEVIRALPARLVVARNTVVELDNGVLRGYDDGKQLRVLMSAGLVARVEIGAVAAPIYESLIDGSARQTLDDGEAATIACAIEQGGVALLDERKARSLCATSYASLPVHCTAEVLMHEAVAAALGPDHIATVVRVLKVGRMRVPFEHVEKLSQLIGPAHASECASLPRSARRTG
jgi:predicted nucleic acid-binding protein